MGAYQQIYIGPYLKIPKVEGTITHEHKKCLTEGCISYKNNLKAKFCPNCGNQTTWVPQIQKVKCSGFSLTDDEQDHWRDTFVFPHNGGSYIEDGYDYLLPNSDKDLVGIIDIDDNFVGGIDILNVNLLEVKEKFIAKYAKYIDKIKADGGEPEICYGMFVHYS
jgi:hypothetical protein